MYPPVEANHSPRDTWGVWVRLATISADVVISPREHHAIVVPPRRKNIEAFSRLFPTR
jgi:hypothetical protein